LALFTSGIAYRNVSISFNLFDLTRNRDMTSEKTITIDIYFPR